MKPTARQHDADLSEKMRGKNTQKHNCGDAAKEFDQKNNSTDAREAFAANVCELQRTLNTVSRAKASDPGLMAKSIGST